MKRRRVASLLLLAGLRVAAASWGQAPDKYVDATPPKLEAHVFAPGIVSISREEGSYEERPVFSPDFRELYFDVVNYKTRSFSSFSMRHQNGHWTKPEPAFFTRYKGIQASFAPDGNRLYFAAPRGNDENSRGIWMAERLRDGWAKPALLESPVNALPNVGFPCVTTSNTLYFLAMTGPGKGLYRAAPKGSAYPAIEKQNVLPAASEYAFGDFYVSPDESFIVFYSNLPGNFGQGDLYVAFRKPDGSWTTPKNLGRKVNTTGYDYAPSISPDGKYLFFTRDRPEHKGHIHWIAAGIVDMLR